MESEERKRFFDEFKRLNKIQSTYEAIEQKRNELLLEIDKLNKELDKRKATYDRLLKMKDSDKVILVVKNAHIVSNSNGFYVYCGSYSGDMDDFYLKTDDDVIDYNDPSVSYSVYRPLEVSFEEPVIIAVEERKQFEDSNPIITPAKTGYAGYNEFKSRYFAGVKNNGEEYAVEYVRKAIGKNKR